MDLILSSLLSLAVLYISYSLIVFVYKRKPNGRDLPPGTTGWPLIGETMEFIASGKTGRPEKFINERRKKYSSEVFKTSLAGEDMVVLCGASGHKFLFSNENKHVVSWWPPTNEKITISTKTSSIGETKKMRSYLPDFLKAEALVKYIAVMDSMTKQHLKTEWVPNREVMVFEMAKKYTFTLACRLFISIEDPEHVARIREHFDLVTAGLFSVPINFPGTAFNRAIKAAKLIRDELRPIVQKRRNILSEKKEEAIRDLLSHMLLSTDEDGKFMSEADMVDKVLGLLIASHDTTSIVITAVVFYLSENPHVFAEVLKEQMEIAKSKGTERPLNWEDVQKMKYSRNVISEAMRLAPPAQGAFKEIISEFTYEGFTIPKGWKAHWSVHSTHRNPKYFPNPEKFDPSRFEGNGPMPFTFVPFGGGPRMCPGNEFARVEILIFMHNLVTKYKWEKIYPDEKIIFDPTPTPAKGLPIRVFPHAN